MEEPQNKTERAAHVSLLVANVVIGFLVVGLAWTIFSSSNKLSQKKVAIEAIPAAFTQVKLAASSAYVLDVNSGRILYEKNATSSHPLASITKLMTAVAIRSLLPQNAIVQITPGALAEEGDSGLLNGEKWSLKNLLDFSLVVSSNDGAEAIALAGGKYLISKTAAADAPVDEQVAETQFVSYMNGAAEKIGLNSMHFTDPTGLDGTSTYGGVGSAQDVAKLLEYTMKTYPDLLESTRDTTIHVNSLEENHVGQNTDLALSKLPDVIASKTGFTDDAGGNLAVSIDTGLNNPVIIVVLGSTTSGRFSDVEALASSTMAFMQK